MKSMFILPVLMLALAAAAAAGEDCSGPADACKTQIKKLTPFMAELKKAEKTPELKQGAAKTPELKQAAPVKEPASEPAREPVPPRQTAPGVRGEFSHPAWLLAVAAMFAGLYWFLRENKRKRKS